MALIKTEMRIGVVRGGPSSEYEVSLKSGARVLSLSLSGYEFKDIFIDRHGLWHKDGVSKQPASIVQNLDGFFNALHGAYGEDGGIQDLFDTFGVPYTGSGKMASAISMRKDLANHCLSCTGIQVPESLVVREGESKENIKVFLHTFPAPWVVKPAGAGSSVGVALVSTEDDLFAAVDAALEHGPAVLIEERIEGREATCGVVENIRGEAVYPLFPVEIIPHGSDFFDYDAKYSGKTIERCPGNFSRSEKEELQALAVQAHQCLGLRHYSRTDFIIHPDRGIVLLEVNSLPGLTEQSLFPLELEASGISFEEFVSHVLKQAMQ